LRIGLIGAGAIAQEAYLPVLEKFSHAHLNAIVDTNTDILGYLSTKYHLGYIGDDLTQSLKYVDAVIVAVPNSHHFSIAKIFLENGKHVLCEKPLAITSEDCKQLISIAKKNNRKLAVAHVRRFYQAAKKTKNIIDSQYLGPIKSFEFDEGTIFNWPTTSGFYFDKKLAGGGVLIDIGVHVLDLLLWWFGNGLRKVDYRDDNLGGVEAVADINIQLSNNIEGFIKLSRLSILKNKYKIYFENGFIEWDPLYSKHFYSHNYAKKTKKMSKIAKEFPVTDMIDDFILSIEDDRKPLVSGEDGLKVIELIERCYHSRRALPLEWLKKN